MSDVGASGTVDAGSVPGQTGQGSVSPAPDVGAAGSETGGPIASPVSDPTPAAPTDWRQGLSDELRAAPALNDVADVGSLAKQFVDQQAFLGNSLRIPGPDAGEGDTSAFHQKLLEKVPGLMPKPDPSNKEIMDVVYQALGRPESAEQYVRPATEGDLPVAEGLYETFAGASHRWGLNQQQHEGIYGEVMQDQAARAQERTAEHEAEYAATRTEWGMAYNEKMQAIHATNERLDAPPELLDAIANGKINGPTAKWLDNIVKMAGGATGEMGAQDGGAKGVMTPAEAELQLMEIQRNPDYNSTDYAVRKPLMDKYQSLLLLAKPGLIHGEDAMRDLKRSASGSS